MDLFREIHSGLPQEAPGSDEATIKALSLIGGLPHSPKIMDIGCGPGRQTITLAEQTEGQIFAVDTHQPFLDELLRRAASHGVGHRVTVINRSMTALDFAGASFDLIWSEGAIYIMGFQKGLKEWRRFLKPGGFVAVTELTWLTDNPPVEARNFWAISYPDMKTRDENMALAEAAGYITIANFTLPDSAWWDGYYGPLSDRVASLREKYSGRPEIIALLNEELAEIDLFKNYSDAYGYVFYILRRG
jgi:ubiquinone/menaquinone biosynthesis C-methylase UbiE